MYRYTFQIQKAFKKRIICCLLIAFYFAQAAYAQQNYSGLLNKELTPDFGSEFFGSLLDRLLYNQDFSGSITTVKVLDDADIYLTVGVNYAGYTKGYIFVSLADNNNNQVQSFPVQKIPIDKDKKQVQFKLQFDLSAYPVDKPFVIPRLIVLASKDEQGKHGIRSTFKINKKFNNPLNGENILLTVNLAPVGSASSLPATLPTSNPGNFKVVLPQKNVYDVIKTKQVYLFKTDTMVAKPKVLTSGSTMMRTVPATSMASRNTVLMRPNLSTISVLHVPSAQPGGTTPPPPNKDPQGPDNNPLSFWGDFIYSDVDFESQDKITSVNLNIYPDKNPNSGIFYYLPIAYDIDYDKNKGFAFDMDYGTAKTDGSDSKVHMSGRLTAGISLFEVQFIKNLMDAYRAQNPGLKLEKPLPLPVAETPEITLGDELKSFGITDVHINNTSSVTDPVEFAWNTDGTTAAELENLLKANSGIIGSMKIKSKNPDFPIQELPVRIRIIDENTLGRFGMTPDEFRNKNWVNATPFPVQLKYLHCMIIDKNKDGKESPIIYSWGLGDLSVPSRAQVKFNSSSVPQWLDNYRGKQARLWLEYNVTDTCAVCNDGVFKKLIHSTTRPQLSDVVFSIIPFFDDNKISYMDIEMRSAQGDPSGGSVVNFPAVHITKDSSDYAVGKIYIAPDAQPSYEYRITVVTKDGQELKSDWQPRNALRSPFGSFQLKQLFPSFNK